MRSRQLVSHPTDPTLMLVPLTRGKVAIVSIEDAAAVGEFYWHLRVQSGSRTCYAQRNVRAAGVHSYQYLHRLIAERVGIVGVDIDHVNRDGLDCSRSNLRGATRAQNEANKGPNSANKSGFRGVHWHAGTGKWRAMIRVGGRIKHLGLFASPEEAGRVAYDARKRAFGAFATAFSLLLALASGVGCAHAPATVEQTENVGQLAAGPSVYSAPMHHDAPPELVGVVDTGDDIPETGPSAADILRAENAKGGTVQGEEKVAHGF